MWLGMKALKFSADAAMEELTGRPEEEENKEPGRGGMVLQIVAFAAIYDCALQVRAALFGDGDR